MTLEVIQKQISEFLSREDPEIICISGKWGSGKTYTWNYMLQNRSRLDGGIFLKRYSYVSLFGMANIDDIKLNVFESTAPTNVDGIIKFSENRIQYIKENWRFVATKLKYYNNSKELAAFIGYSLVDRTIICFDDFERISDIKLRSDILGLLLSLKEKKNCKIVLLLNDEKLGEGKQAFDEYVEKIADTYVKFQITPSEAAKIAFSDDLKFRQEIINHCVNLNISNIRILKGIEKFSRDLLKGISSKNELIIKQLLHSMTLFYASRLKLDGLPSIDFLKSYNHIVLSINEKHLDEYEKKYDELLVSYNWNHADDLDLLVMEGVTNGYFDYQKINVEIDKMEIYLKKNNSKNLLHDAWRMYHDSFEENLEQILSAMVEAIEKTPESITPNNFDATLTFLSNFLEDQKITQLVDIYISSRNEDINFWDLDKYVFGDLRNQKLTDKFKEKFLEYKKPVDLEDLLYQMGVGSGWLLSDVKDIVEVSSDDFYRIIKRNNGDRLNYILKGISMLKQQNGLGVDLSMAIQASENALLQISSESDLNKMRIYSKGFRLESSNIIK